jgi:hypothetical protein
MSSSSGDDAHIERMYAGMGEEFSEMHTSMVEDSSEMYTSMVEEGPTSKII